MLGRVTAGGCPDAPRTGTSNNAKATRLVTAKDVDRRVIDRVAFSIRADDRARIRLTNSRSQCNLLGQGIRYKIPAECLTIFAVDECALTCNIDCSRIDTPFTYFAV